MDFRVGTNYDFRIAAFVLAAFFFLFFLFPIASIFLTFLDSLFNEQFLISIGKNSGLLFNSFLQAIFSTFFSVFIGIPAGILIARRDFPGKKIVSSLSLVPFVFPSVLVVISFVIVFGNNGWINTFLRSFLGFDEHVKFLYGFSGIILAHSFYNFPLVMRFVSSYLERMDFTLKESAYTLGASPFKVFFLITLPRLVPAILSSAALVFIFTFMSFVIVLTLGGIQFTTFEVEIYRQITRNLNFELGAFLSLFQFGILALISFFYYTLSKGFLTKVKTKPEPPSKFDFSIKSVAELLFLLLIVLFVTLPILSLFAFAFFDSGSLSLRAFEKLFFSGNFGFSAFSAIFYSLLIAFLSSITAVTIALIAALRKKISFLSILLSASIGISPITLAFGYFLSYGSGFLWVIIAGHAVLSFPFAFRVISNAVSQIEFSLIDSARLLGASGLSLFSKIRWPLLKNSIIASLVFGFSISLGELALVLVLSDGNYSTIPVYIYRLLSAYDLHAATAMGLILVMVSFFSFYLIDKYLGNRGVLV